MYRSLAFTLLFIFFHISFAYAEGNTDSCRQLLQNESDLDKVYDLSKLVFVARITPRPGVNKQIYNFRVYPPELKGKVPEQGFITFAPGCKPLATDSIYVFFLVSLKEKIQGFNSIFMSLPDGTGYTWIADWIQKKKSENENSEHGSKETK